MVKFQFSYLQPGTIGLNHKTLIQKKLTRSKPFRSYLMEKNNWLRGNGTIMSRSDW